MMIEDALKELNEKAGSTKKSISQYLEKKYDNLPGAHTVLLKHHLEKACKERQIKVTCTKKYRLAGSLNSGAKVKRKPQKSKWKWECERQKHHQLKIRLVKTRSDQRGEAINKCDEQEQPLTENGEDQTKSLHSNPSCVDGGEKNFHSNPSILYEEPLGMISEMKYSEEVRSQQKNGPSSVAEAVHQGMEHLEHEQPELSTPERPPGFESVRVENLHQLDVVDVMNANEKSKLPAVLQKEHVFEPYMTTIDSSEFALSTEQESKGQLPSQKTETFQGKQLRRSLRTRPPAKPGVAAALPPEGCPEVRPVRVSRRLGASLKQRPRSWPPPKPMKTTSMDEPQDSPKFQKQRMQLLKQSPVKNLKVVDDCREQELEQLGKLTECSPMHEKMEVLPPDNSKPQALKEQRLGRTPNGRSARLLK
ncbi:uncharacterized protein LOC130986276 isoform X2 [Salvia miltiorrhiza]|uniref:uncharacterized protein LOC130986276 isoform X2 n=1 Tax=Salvia miltiorrhiza TaxID=226208 RepID=UPI0025AB8107|nr:uncharacterized protein LOC130986276 isoform X2 [Salvia miltiorrhiza]